MKSILVLLTAMASMSNISINSRKYCEFSITQHVIQERNISDFSDNEFKLYELEHGYAIYEIINNEEVFIEGSYKVNSPFYEFQNNQIYYLGLGNYYYTDNDNVININTNEIKNLEDYSNCTYSISNKNYEIIENSTFELERSAEPTLPNDYVTDSEGYTLIPRHEYFRKLKYFPQNYRTCAVVASSMLLGYFDTFYNNFFVPTETYLAKYYEKNDNGEYVLNHIENENLMKTVEANYINSSSYSFNNWNEMPGASHALHTYLMDNYLHTIGSIGNNTTGYPMTGLQISNTINDYLEENCLHIINNIYTKYGISNVESKVKEYIDKGYPVLVSATSLTHGEDVTENHTTLVYGYKDNKFIMHFGWWPGSLSSAEIVVSSYNFYSYYVLIFTGSHFHSNNVYMSVPGKEENATICGCGVVSWPLC